jgi:RimJ/RimL family protein N-acetyltransferase
VIADATALATRLVDEDLVVEPLTERHREPLRAACAADPDIWAIYSTGFIGAHFDPAFDGLLASPARTMLAVVRDGNVVGMSGYLHIAPEHCRLEIGNTYIQPAVRGTGLNGRVKRLMLRHAFACGFDRIEFRIDVRNARSQAAVRKLGAAFEGVMCRHMVTWTGHVRDTALFAILRDEWRDLELADRERAA